MPMLGIIAVVMALAMLFAIVMFVRRQRHLTGFVDLKMLRQLSWGELEILVADYFVREGFVIREQNGKAVDFVMEKNGQCHLVQCKHWRSKTVDDTEVRALFGHMAAMNAGSAYLLTVGRFTPSAVQFASGKRIDLVDGPALAKMIEEIQQDPSEITQSRLDALRDAEQTAPRRVILCPRCGRMMVRRHARGQPEEGKREFYGCSRYPTCKGRREIA